MQLENKNIYEEWHAEKKLRRRRLFIVCVIALIVFLICICFKYEQYEQSGIFFPERYLRVYLTRLGIAFSGIWKGEYWHERQVLLDAIGVFDYVGAMNRLKITVMAAVSGAGLAIAGAIFQTIYKNPLASPNILGATAGVQLGNILMVMLYGGQTLVLVGLRYKTCYLLTAACVGGILILGRMAGDKSGNPAVLKMVMAGSIINQGIGTFAMNYMYQLSDEDLLVYQQISMGTYIDTTLVSMLVFFIVMAASIVPMALFRYRFNIMGINEAEVRTAGINPAGYRLIGQVCGVLMVTAAMIHSGQAGMLSMVLPFVVRHVVGSEFRRVFFFSALSGAILMMICRTVSSCAVIRSGTGDVLIDANLMPITLPVAFIINICLLPFFMMILAKQRSAFE